MRTFARDELNIADLHVDAKYEGNRGRGFGNDPLPSLLGVCNQGGFRILGSKEHPRLIVITTSLVDPEWPDELDPETGIFTYFGDNKIPGLDLHGTERFGNVLLRNVFNAIHTGGRSAVPPILVFSNAEKFRDKIFRGLAVPGAPGLSHQEDLVAIWKILGTDRFLNYRAKFTILDVPCINRKWIDDIRNGEGSRANAPEPWLSWIQTGKYKPLRALRALEIRGKVDQLPASGPEEEILSAIYSFFSDNPHGFESCAAEIARMALGNVVSLDLTRPSRDGGRDAIGLYQIGSGVSSVTVDFSIEAKCYSMSNSVGVRDISRLISRLRHRQFGVLVTTSWVHSQAYREIKEDRHPIVIISGADIVRTLKSHGIDSASKTIGWLKLMFV